MVLYYVLHREFVCCVEDTKLIYIFVYINSNKQTNKQTKRCIHTIHLRPIPIPPLSSIKTPL